MTLVHRRLIQELRRLERVVIGFPVAFDCFQLLLRWWPLELRRPFWFLEHNSVIVGFIVDFGLHELKPVVQSLVVFEEILVLKDELLNEHWRLLLEILREIVRQGFEADLG